MLSVPKLNMSNSTSGAKLISEIDDWFAELQKQNKFNGVVLLRKNGKTKLSKGYGFRDHKKVDKLSPSSSLRIASMSKQFTAVGIIILKEEKKLNYNDSIKKYLPSIPYSNVTIRHLLNQTSGIPDIYIDLAKRNKDSFEILDNKIAIDLLIKENKEPLFKPNDQFQYSNTNYIILARIIEIITNSTFEEFMKTKLFQPLGMVDSRIWNLYSDDKSFNRQAEDMELVKGTFKKIEPDYIDGVAGDGAVFTSINDLEIWDDFWYGKRFLNQVALKEAFTKNILNDGKNSPYGFGWMLTANGMWHDGGWLGARSMLIRNVKQKICIAIIDNCSNIYFDKILDEIEKIDNDKWN